jgi:hypothetical protein
MLPQDLKPELFKGYPPEARKLVVESVGTLQALPLSFLASLLREAIDYDFKFPAEREAVKKELVNLKSLSVDQTKIWFSEFEKIQLSPALENVDWINAPAQFVEQLSAYLWTTHQLHAFRAAAVDYAARLLQTVPSEKPAIPRLGISVIGRGVSSHDEPLFRKLRPHGAYFNRIKPDGGLKSLLDGISARAKTHPAPYGHWYIDGGEETEHDPELTVSPIKLWSPPAPPGCGKCETKSNAPARGPKLCVPCWPRCVPLIWAWEKPETWCSTASGSGCSPKDQVPRSSARLSRNGLPERRCVAHSP